MDAGDKERLQKAVDETVSWLGESQEASKEEFESRKKELEGISHPIMSKLYGGGAFPNGSASDNFAADGPTVEEVD